MGIVVRKIARFIEDKIIQSLKTFPVVYIAGPRQSGKTTLAQKIADTSHKATYITFDDVQILSSAQRDPEAFLRSLEGHVVLDEIQMAPELFRPLKIIVDENRNLKDGGRGKFLLTGSASVMALPKLSDALVGRMALHTLPPFSAQEIQENKGENFIDSAFSKEWKYKQLSKETLLEIMVSATFPEVMALPNQSLRYDWCNGYMNTILQRDVRVLMEIEKIRILPDMLRLLAAHTGGLLNESTLSRDTNLNHITVKRYRLLLENLFLTLSIPAWSKNLGKRLIKSPKIYIGDLNMLSYLLKSELKDIEKENQNLFGHVLENFIAIELAKQLTFSSTRAELYHYRTASGQEVDFILEGPQNQVIGIEVKANSKINEKDFLHLEVLRNELGATFKRGFVFYRGKDILPFGKDMWAVPISTLWDCCEITV